VKRDRSAKRGEEDGGGYDFLAKTKKQMSPNPGKIMSVK
jgi:hypothetical protein